MKTNIHTQIVFSKAEWVGSLEDNPQEEPLPLPDHLTQQQQQPHHGVGPHDYAFGAGAALVGLRWRGGCNDGVTMGVTRCVTMGVKGGGGECSHPSMTHSAKWPW